MGQQGPTTPFPETVDTITVALPLPTIPPRGREPISEMTFDFVRVDERSYIVRAGRVTRYMSAAEYEADTVFGKPFARAAFVVNARSQKVGAALRIALTAAAKGYALRYAYLNQHPPLPLPPNSGIGHPFSRESVTVLDGTARLRGFCSGLHTLDPSLVQSTTVAFAPVFAKEDGGGEQ
jgi:hypothetical protein